MKAFVPITRRHDKPVVAMAALVIAVAGMAALAGRGLAQEKSARNAPPGLLMLIRSWSPASGELIGWMPMNRVAITLGLLPDQKGTPSFELNDAVSVRFPYRPNEPVKYGRMKIVSKMMAIEGQEWIPAEAAPNLVRIRKYVFYVKSIDFGESKWQQAAAPVVVPRRSGKGLE